MFKRLSLLLLSLMVVPFAANAGVDAFKCDQEVNVALADPEPEDEYTYTEFDASGSIIRTYDTHYFAPSVIKTFCKPAGYVFTLSTDEPRLNALLDQTDLVGNDYYYINYVIKYVTFGSEVYVDSGNYWSSTDDVNYERIEMRDKMRIFTNDLQLLKVEEVIVPTDICVLFEISFSTATHDWYTFRCFGDTIHMEPFDETDFITPSVQYYEEADRGEFRINVKSFVHENFFNEYPNYNKFGFKTDETEKVYVDTEDYTCVYHMTLIGYDSIPLGFFDSNGGLELTYPDNPIPVKIKMEFDSDSRHYSYYSKDFIIGNPSLSVTIDGDVGRTSVQKNNDHVYSFHIDNFDFENIEYLDCYIGAYPYRIYDEEYVVFVMNDEFPSVGEVGKLYYKPSDAEVELINAGRMEEFYARDAEGTYYNWNTELNDFEYYGGLMILNNYFSTFYDENAVFDFNKYLTSVASFPYTGRWFFNVQFWSFTDFVNYHLENSKQTIEVVESGATEEDVIILHDTDGLELGSNINLLINTADFVIVPTVSNYNKYVSYYYDYELSRDGVVELSEGENDEIILKPVGSGVVTLTVYCESKLFSTISKTISIRVLDAIYDVAKIEVPNEFHYAGKDLTISLSIRGFTDFQNLNIEWKVVDKEGNVLPADKYRINKNATLTLLNPDSEDYTITASYEGIELDSVTIQVRYVNLNQFLRNNIWWIFIITASFVALMVFLMAITKRSKTVVEHIEKAYQLFCNCLRDDKLTKEELVRIKREITRCKRRCEDLNIDALNQYEKSTRYLRKSLIDAKALLAKYDTLSPADRDVLTAGLDKDLAKALNVAKEIEQAKGLIEAYHSQANRQNFEVLVDENGNAKKKKKKE